MQYGFKVTTRGREIIASCAALEKPLVITKVSFGNGDPGEEDFAERKILASYVCDGEIGARWKDENKFYCSVQYDNSKHPELDAFELTEFMVYATDPETEEETPLAYGCLGDFSERTTKYVEGMAPVTQTFRITMVMSNEVNVEVTASSGAPTEEDIAEVREVAERASKATADAKEATAAALEATEKSKEAAGHSPIIKEGNWWNWDYDNQEYKDTGMPARGEVGPNLVNSTTPTNIEGLLKGASGFVGKAEPGVDYVIPKAVEDMARRTEMMDFLAGKQDTLTFDDEPDPLSQNPVKSSGIDKAIQAVKDIATEAKTIAEGRNRGIVFSDYQSVVADLNAAGKGKYNKGDNLFVVTMEVPDLWIISEEASSVEYAYTTDEALVAALAEGPVQIGLYKVGKLETSKVDLSEIEAKLSKKAEKEEVNTALAGKQDKLTFDDAPKSGSANPVKSGGVYTELAAKADEKSVTERLAKKVESSVYTEGLASKQDKLTFDDAPKADSPNPVKSGGIFTALSGKQNALTFDATPTSKSENPVKSGGVFDALAGKQNSLTFDDTPQANSTNPVKSGGIHSALAGKQATLTFDDAPKSGSANPVKSGGVFSALAGKQGSITVTGMLKGTGTAVAAAAAGTDYFAAKTSTTDPGAGSALATGTLLLIYEA